MYTTPARFRALGLGIDLSDVDDLTLRSTIQRASAMVDSYCAVPLLPQKYDFRGGTITGEQHRWRIPLTSNELGSRRYYAWHQPIIQILQFRIYVTNTQYVEIAPSELYVQNSEGYAEVVSLALTSAGLFNALIIPNVGLATPTAVMNYTYGWLFTTTGAQLDTEDLKVYRASNGWWSATPTPVVYLNGAVNTSNTVNLDEGTVTFTGALAATDIVTVDYTYRLPPAIEQATALLTVNQLGERELRKVKMTSLNVLRMEELELRRSAGSRSTSAASTVPVIPEDVRILLADFSFATARGGVVGVV